MCVCGRVTVLYSRNWHDVVNQLYFNKTLKMKKEEKKKSAKNLKKKGGEFPSWHSGNKSSWEP